MLINFQIYMLIQYWFHHLLAPTIYIVSLTWASIAIMPLVITRALTSFKPGYLFGTKIFECKGNKVFIIILLFVKSITSPVLILWDLVTHWAMFLLQCICTHFLIWYRWQLLRREFNRHWRRLGPKWRWTHIWWLRSWWKHVKLKWKNSVETRTLSVREDQNMLIGWTLN